MSTTTGTVKIGRWTYPTIERDGDILRNTKRDGTGEWVSLPDSAVVTPVASPTAAEVETGRPSADSAELTAYGFAVMAAIGNREFDFFDDGVVEGSGIWFDHMASQLPGYSRGTGKRELRKLEKAGLVGIGDVDTDASDRWLYLTAKGAAAAAQLEGRKIAFPELGEPKARKSSTPRVRKTDEPSKPCTCECGENAKAGRLYLPGHDARHAGQIARAMAELTDGKKQAALLESLPTAALRDKAGRHFDRLVAKAAAKAAKSSK